MYSRKPISSNRLNGGNKQANSYDGYYDGRRGTIRVGQKVETNDDSKNTTKSKCK